MRLDVSVDLKEAAQILREQLALKTGVKPDDIGDIAITSYGKPRIIFYITGLVTAIDTNHRLVE